VSLATAKPRYHLAEQRVDERLEAGLVERRGQRDAVAGRGQGELGERGGDGAATTTTATSRRRNPMRAV
jgi:hypothetical protein